MSTFVSFYFPFSWFVFICKIEISEKNFRQNNYFNMNIVKSVLTNNAKVGRITHGTQKHFYFLPFWLISEHFKSIEYSEKEFGSCADCYWTDWKRRESLRHLLETFKRENYMPNGSDRWWNQFVDHCTIVVFTIRKFDEANSHVHQLTRRIRHIWPCNLRHNVSNWLILNLTLIKLLNLFSRQYVKPPIGNLCRSNLFINSIKFPTKTL